MGLSVEPFTEETQEHLLSLLAPDYIEGMTLLGGEPMYPKNQEALLPFVKKIRDTYPNKTIWCFTGYDFEKEILAKMVPESETTRELLSLFDVMVDGRFVEEKTKSEPKIPWF